MATSEANSLAILAAIVKSSNGDGIYLINEDKSYFKTITTGITDGNLIEVITGLKAGDKIEVFNQLP